MSRLVRLSLRGAGIALAVAVCVTACPNPADAQVYNHRDAIHDVNSADVDDPSNPHQEPTNKSFDITHLRVIHGPKMIRFKVKLRSASLKGLYSRSLVFEMRTNRHSYSGSWDMYHGELQYTVFENKVGVVKCYAQNSRTQIKRRTIWWSFPRSCFHNPRWIRVAVAVRGQPSDRSRWLGDTAQSSSWHPRRTFYTPRLRPGT